MAVNYRMGRRGDLRNYNAQPRSRVTVWKPPGEPTPPVIPVDLTLGAGNRLDLGGVSNPPEWLTAATFTLTHTGGVITFTWVTDHWETTDEFPSASGTGIVTQAGNEWTARWFNADVNLGPVIEQADAVYWMGANNTQILWSGIDG